MLGRRDLRWLEIMIGSWPFNSDWQMLLQMVNFNQASQIVDVEVKGLLGSPTSMMVTTLNSTDSTAENTFDTPLLVGSLLADLFTSTCCELYSRALERKHLCETPFLVGSFPYTSTYCEMQSGARTPLRTLNGRQLAKLKLLNL